MIVASLVERIELTNRAADWIVANRRRLAPPFWIAAILAPFAVFWIGPQMLQDAAVKNARSAHAEWSVTGKIAGGHVISPREFLTGLRQLGPPPHLPDLSANGLDIARVSFVPSEQNRGGAIHVGYRNGDGCRISLWIVPSDTSGEGPLSEQHRGVAFSWRADGLRYVIVRSGMRHERFHLLAKSARLSTLSRAPLSGPRNLALSASTFFGRPCND
jgi:hypothetical protein